MSRYNVVIKTQRPHYPPLQPKQPVYLHCKVGRDRTGTFAAIYRIEVDGWTNEEAMEELQAFGYHDYYKDLINFVKKYKPKGFKAPK